MLDGGLPDAHFQLRQPLADLLHPDVPAQDSQRLRHRLVQRFGGDLDSVIGPGEVATGGNGLSAAHDPRKELASAAKLMHLALPARLAGDLIGPSYTHTDASQTEEFFTTLRMRRNEIAMRAERWPAIQQALIQYRDRLNQ